MYVVSWAINQNRNIQESFNTQTHTHYSHNEHDTMVTTIYSISIIYLFSMQK